jgi:N-carbamoyl-L-amino-acid hydrolase
MREECESLGYPYMELPSGAGHDAQILAGIADVGMIFIPCEDGISHSQEERIQWEDLEKGANLLLRTLLRLAS